jgi:hypothetical protein
MVGIILKKHKVAKFYPAKLKTCNPFHLKTMSHNELGNSITSSDEIVVWQIRDQEIFSGLCNAIA